MVKQIFIILFLSLSAVACNKTTKPQGEAAHAMQAVGDEGDLPYEVAENYFVKNTVPDSVFTSKITSQSVFDDYFGAAYTMAQDGSPTAIDFSVQYVLAVIGKESDRAVTALPLGLKKEGDAIVFSYRWDESAESQGYMSRYALLIVVDRSCEGKVIFDKQ